MELIIYLLKSAAILSIFYFTYRILLERETFFKENRYFLLMGILISALAPALTFTRIIYKQSPLLNFAIPQNDNFQNNDLNDAWFSYTGWELACLFYAIGVGIMVILFSIKLYAIIRFVRQESTYSEFGYHYIQVDGLKSPFSFFNYIIIDKKNHSDEELAMILLHEQAHANQRHSIDMLIAEVLLIIHWFNPMAWFYKKAIDQNLEFLADATTAHQLADQKKYQLTLVQVSIAPRKAMLNLTHSFYQSFIKKRIVMLNKQESNSMRRAKLCIILPVIAVFIWSFNVKEVVSYTSETGKNSSKLSAIQNDKANSITNKGNQLNTETTMSAEIGGQIFDQKDAYQDPKAFKKIISKSASKEELDALVDELKTEYNVTLNYSNLNYNSEGLIISIKLEVKDGESGSQSTTSYNSSKPVGDIVIYRTEGGSFGVVSGSNKVVQRSNNDKNEASESMTEDMNSRRADIAARREELRTRRIQMRAKADSVFKNVQIERMYASQPSQNPSSISQKALIVVDGKVVKDLDLNSIDPNTIESINVLKGEENIKPYKDQLEGKSGVILINLKKNK